MTATHKQVSEFTHTRAGTRMHASHYVSIGSEDAIEIYTPQRPYRIYVRSNSEKKLWLPKIRETIYQHLLNAKQLHDMESSK